MTNQRHVTRHKKWLILFGLALWAGCSFSGDAPGEDSAEEASDSPRTHNIDVTESQPVVYHDNVYQVSDETAPFIELEGTQVSIPLSKMGNLSTLEVEDVLFSDHSPSFRLRITEIIEERDHLVLTGVPADLTEVVKEGQFQVYIPPSTVGEDIPVIELGATSDISQRQQAQSSDSELEEAANSGGGGGGSGSGGGSGTGTGTGSGGSASVDEYETASLDYSVNFSNIGLLEYENASATIDMVDSSLTFKPGLLVTFTISTATGVSIGIEVAGNVHMKTEWDIEASGAFAMDRMFAIPVSGGYGFTVDGIAGGTYTINPFLHVHANIEGEGHGSYNQMMESIGEANAGITQENLSTIPHFEHQFTTSSSTEVTGNVEADIQFGFEAGVTLYKGGTNGQQMAEAVPLSASLTASAQVNPPNCPYDAQIVFDSYIVDSSEISSLFNHSYTALDTNGDLTSIPGCMANYSAGECGTDQDCGRGMQCRNGMCQPDADLTVTLAWHDEANLDLNLMTTDGNTVNVENPGASTDQCQLIETSCGGCEEESSGYAEIIIYDDVEAGDRMNVWVQNDQGRHEGNDGEGPISYQLTFSHRDVYEQTFHGEMGEEPGASSFQYRYTVPQ